MEKLADAVLPLHNHIVLALHRASGLSKTTVQQQAMADRKILFTRTENTTKAKQMSNKLVLKNLYMFATVTTGYIIYIYTIHTVGGSEVLHTYS